MKRLILLTALLSVFSCESSKKTTENNLVNSALTTEEIYRFRVSFFSIGNGIDGDALNEYLNFIRSFETKINASISYEVHQWGKEGETNFCFKLIELSKVDQKSFISESKENLKNTNLVRCIENEPCLHN